MGFSTLSTSGRNTGSKSTKWPPKCHFLQTKLFFNVNIAYLIDFDLLKTKICIINTFGEQLSVEKRLKSKNSKWPPLPEVLQKLKLIALLNAFDLLNIKIF